MPEFILDTSGEVQAPPSALKGPWPHPMAWRHLDNFTKGYIEAMFFTENEPGTTREERVATRGTVRKTWRARVEGGQIKDMPGDYGFEELAPATLLEIMRDCRDFQAGAAWQAGLNADDLADDQTPFCLRETEAGRDFLYTRQGYGGGFWDGDWPAPHDDALTEASKAFREFDVDIADDGKVYVS